MPKQLPVLVSTSTQDPWLPTWPSIKPVTQQQDKLTRLSTRPRTMPVRGIPSKPLKNLRPATFIMIHFHWTMPYYLENKIKFYYFIYSKTCINSFALLLRMIVLQSRWQFVLAEVSRGFSKASVSPGFSCAHSGFFPGFLFRRENVSRQNHHP